MQELLKITVKIPKEPSTRQLKRNQLKIQCLDITHKKEHT
jgi:hypothetical protein